MTISNIAYMVFAVWALWAMGSFLRVIWFMVCPPQPVGKLTSNWVIAEFDMWIGAYIDRKNNIAYWFPLPCVGKKYERR